MNAARHQTTAPTTGRALWPIWFGMTIAGTAAVVASAYTLAALATAAGWAAWTPWLLPASIDVGGAVGGWCWLRPGAPDRARAYGRGLALTGGAGTILGNAVGHLVSSGYLQPGPVLVVVVGAVPAAMLVALAHLAALLIVPARDAATVAPALVDEDAAREAAADVRVTTPAGVSPTPAAVGLEGPADAPTPVAAPPAPARPAAAARAQADDDVIREAREVAAELAAVGKRASYSTVHAGLKARGVRIGGTRMTRVMQAISDPAGVGERDDVDDDRTERVA